MDEILGREKPLFPLWARLLAGIGLFCFAIIVGVGFGWGAKVVCGWLVTLI